MNVGNTFEQFQRADELGPVIQSEVRKKEKKLMLDFNAYIYIYIYALKWY